MSHFLARPISRKKREKLQKKYICIINNCLTIANENMADKMAKFRGNWLSKEK